MSTKRVTIEFVGEGGKLSKAVGDVEQDVDRLGDAMKDVGRKAAPEMGGGFDRAGEAADLMDTRAMGFRDTMTGVQDSMSGAASIAKGDLFTGFFTLGMGIGDLGSGLYNFIIPGLKSFSLTAIKAKAASIGTAIASKTAAAASKAWAAGQWLLNAALTANPIGLVVVAIALLVAGLILAYKKSETFRKIVNAAFGAVAKAAQVAFKWVIDKASAALGWIKGNWKTLLAILTGPIGIAVLVISRNWDKIKAGARGAVDWVKGRFNDLVGFFRGIPSRVSGAASGMWDGIKNAFRSSINYIIGKWNSLSFSLPSVNVPGIGKIGGFTLSTPNIPYLAKGGIVTRPTLAVIGEAGPEAVIPLNRGRGSVGGGGFHLHLHGPVYGDPRAYGKGIVDALRAERRFTNKSLEQLLGAT